MAAKRARLLWLDMEMTGLNPEQDRVLELAAVATDWSLRELATFTAVVRQPAAAELMVGEFWERHAALKQSLLLQNADGQPEATVGAELVAFVREHFPTGDARKPIYLAGNSIHQDRRFLRRYFPEVDGFFHYRLLDVSAWKIIFSHKYHHKIQKPEAHRALDDIRGSLAEMVTYLTVIERGVKRETGEDDGDD